MTVTALSAKASSGPIQVAPWDEHDQTPVSYIWRPAVWPLWTVGLAWLIGGVIDVWRWRRARRLVLAAPGAPLPRVSVIVPVLNEEARIGGQLEHLAAVADLHEIIVVDGGSVDRTVEFVRQIHAVRLLARQRGRAGQMNAGAEVATGDVLLFLHADVRLPTEAVRWIAAALREPGTVAGAFHTWTVADDQRRPWWRSLLHLADVRSRYSGLPYGDQAVFVRAEVFAEIGGFADLPLMEDLVMSRALRARGAIRIVPQRVVVSGRRFLLRPFYYTLLVNLFPLLHRLGVSADLLARYYEHPRDRGKGRT